MGQLSQEEINVDLFNEVKRLREENQQLKQVNSDMLNAIGEEHDTSDYAFSMVENLKEENNQLRKVNQGMLNALIRTRKLVSQFAESGFNPFTEPFVAQELFANQAFLTAAIKSSEELSNGKS